jgi:hypothetical protein
MIIISRLIAAPRSTLNVNAVPNMSSDGDDCRINACVNGRSSNVSTITRTEVAIATRPKSTDSQNQAIVPGIYPRLSRCSLWQFVAIYLTCSSLPTWGVDRSHGPDAAKPTPPLRFCCSPLVKPHMPRVYSLWRTANLTAALLPGRRFPRSPSGYRPSPAYASSCSLNAPAESLSGVIDRDAGSIAGR